MSGASPDRPAGRPAFDYPCGEPPLPGQAREVAPGVLWLRMPMPFALTHINLYALRDGDGWAVIDCGLQTEETAAAWQTLLGRGGALGDGGLTRVFATHMHPDHVGLAGWLTRRADGRVWMTRAEYLSCRVLAADTGREAPPDAVAFYRRAGWDAAALDVYRARFGSFGRHIHALPEQYRRLVDGEVLDIGGQAWRVIVGAGHSPEHACFHAPALGLLVSGDQVLPRISSNVSVFPTEPEDDPLGAWLDSIAKLRREVPDDVLVLPAHNEPFRGLHVRLDQLERSARQGLAALHERLRRPARVVDVFETLFSRPIVQDHHLLSLATGETVAHLNHLIGLGQVERRLDADGVAWYQQR